jgi:hypothetical protein
MSCSRSPPKTVTDITCLVIAVTDGEAPRNP